MGGIPYLHKKGAYLETSNFFTKEVDECLINKGCRIAIHSAKDLPEHLAEGLQIIALTKGGNWKVFDKSSINTSFPTFLSILKKLGAKFS